MCDETRTFGDTTFVCIREDHDHLVFRVPPYNKRVGYDVPQAGKHYMIPQQYL